MIEKKLTELIRGIQHIGIPVTDLTVSEAFYSRLGFSKIMESPFTEEGHTGTCAMMKKGTIVLELYQLPPHKLQAIRERKDGHIDHITFDVEEIDEAFELLKAASFRIIEQEPVFLPFWENGCRYFNMIGPDGERLEFNQIL